LKIYYYLILYLPFTIIYIYLLNFIGNFLQLSVNLTFHVLDDSSGGKHEPNFDSNTDHYIPLENTASAIQNYTYTSKLPFSNYNQGGNDLILYWEHFV